MKIGLVGLGKMGSNLAFNFKDHGIEIVGYDLDEKARAKMEREGFETVSSLKELVNNLPGRRVVWMMVPADVTHTCIQELQQYLSQKDIVVDAGNSNYKNSIKHAEQLKKLDICFLDVGTSGGISGARNGACLMIGGDKEAYNYLETVFHSISQKDGCLYAGEAGSGHFMKMVHNGIEYGMMQAIGEGFELLKESPFDYNLADVANNWNHGSVIRSWLMELAQQQFSAHHDLGDIKGIVAASGEAKWAVETALEMEIPVPIISLSLMIRNASLESDRFSCKVVAALRNGFGGHAYVKK